jgi:hypothetical protein
MNIDFIKHIISSELRWKSKYINRSFFAVTIALAVLMFGGKGVKDFAILIFFFGAMIPAIGSMQSSIIPTAANQMNQNAQSGSFSWKYIHTIVHDRRSFIVGYIISGIIGSAPTLVFGIGASIHYKVGFQFFSLALIPFILFVALLRQGSILNTIQFPRRVYYRYNVDDGLMAFFKWCYTEFSKFLVFLFTGLSCFFFVKFFLEINLIYAVGAGVVCLLIFNLLTFNRILSVWADERKSRPNPKGNYIKAVKLIPLALVLGYANVHFYGYIIRNDARLFRYVKENNLKELKKSNVAKIVNTLTDKDGFYLLHEAALFGKKDVANFLIENKADLNVKITGIDKKRYEYRNGMTPLHIALDTNHSEIAKLLIEKGADINAISSKGHTPLSIATFRCNPYLMKDLIEKGADINHKTVNGFTPLHLAAQGRCETGIVYLLKVGADEDLHNKDGHTYIEFSKEKDPHFYNLLQFKQTELKIKR